MVHTHVALDVLLKVERKLKIAHLVSVECYGLLLKYIHSINSLFPFFVWSTPLHFLSFSFIPLSLITCSILLSLSYSHKMIDSKYSLMYPQRFLWTCLLAAPYHSSSLWSPLYPHHMLILQCTVTQRILAYTATHIKTSIGLVCTHLHQPRLRKNTQNWHQKLNNHHTRPLSTKLDLPQNSRRPAEHLMLNISTGLIITPQILQTRL